MSLGTTRIRPEYRNLLDTNSNTGPAGGLSGPCSRRVRISNPQGLHMRPAAAFAQLARQFSGSVTVRHGEHNVNGKSWVDLMLLAALPGTELVVEVDGPDGPSALEALSHLLGSDGAEPFPASPAGVPPSPKG